MFWILFHIRFPKFLSYFLGIDNTISVLESNTRWIIWCVESSNWQTWCWTWQVTKNEYPFRGWKLIVPVFRGSWQAGMSSADQLMPVAAADHTNGPLNLFSVKIYAEWLLQFAIFREANFRYSNLCSCTRYQLRFMGRLGSGGIMGRLGEIEEINK